MKRNHSYQERLKDNERILTHSQKIGGMGSWEVDLVTSKTFWSEQMYRILGLEPSALEPSWDNYLSLIHPEDRNDFLKRTGNYMKVGGAFSHVYRIQRADGVVVVIRSEGEILLDADNQPRKIFGVVEDVTQRQLAEQKLRESERLLAQSQRIAGIGSWEMNIETQEVVLSEEMFQVFGLDIQDSFTYQDFLSLIHPEDLPQVQFRINKFLESGGSYEHTYRIIDARGNVRLIQSIGEVVQDDLGKAEKVRGVGKDVTEQSKQNEEVRRLSLIAEKTVNAVLITDVDGKVEWVNEAFTRMTGFEQEEILGKKSRYVLHGIGTDKTIQAFKESQMSQQQPFHCELLKYKKSGESFWVEIDGQPVFDEEGNFLYFFEIETDITDQKRHYDNLIRSKNESKAFAKEMNEVLEEERARIAREIHDELGQQLVGLKMSFAALNKKTSFAAGDLNLANEIGYGLSRAIQTIRDISLDLRPAILDTLGLIPSLNWLIQEFERVTQIPCIKSFDTSVDFFHKSISIAYFRICQEALNNVMKHAEATELRVVVVEKNGYLNMEIKDNGKGIPDSQKTFFSRGLLGMRERANLIGGELIIFSGERGTTVQINSKIKFGEKEEDIDS
ncbi:MAG: PAS domain-containing protein [Marinoscillum sp.]|uniref:sensor histidine kinase n=1 Tax=Marinoscillum sp. TaxID=2024838 RepID=UPI0032F0E10D